MSLLYCYKVLSFYVTSDNLLARVQWRIQDFHKGDAEQGNRGDG